MKAVFLHAIAICMLAPCILSAAADLHYANLPLAFEPNQGQADAAVRFLARTPSAKVFIADTEVVLALERSQQPSGGGCQPQAAVRMKLVGARTPCSAEGLNCLPGVAAARGSPPYAGMRLGGVYEEIDLVAQRNLEYDFIVAAGADVDCVDRDI